MPDLDVSDLLLDPDFCEPLSIYRRPVTMVKGRQQIASQLVQPFPVGVVFSISGELMRATDQQNLPTTIVVHTPFRLRGPAKGFQADIVNWNGDNFVVRAVDNYSHYGAGFVAAICSSEDMIDNAPANPFTLDQSNLDGPDVLL